MNELEGVPLFRDRDWPRAFTHRTSARSGTLERFIAPPWGRIIDMQVMKDDHGDLFLSYIVHMDEPPKPTLLQRIKALWLEVVDHET